MSVLNPDQLQGALNDLGQPDPAPDPAPSPTPTPTPEPVVDDLFEVKVGGKAWKVPREELVAGYQRQQDYTRKTMELAEQRRAWEQQQQQFQQQLDEMRTWLSDPANVQQYYQYLLQQKGGISDPNELLTAEQAQKLIEQERQRLTAQTQAQLTHATRELELRQMAATYASEIDTTIKGLVDQFPELKGVKRIDRILKEEVAAREPQSLEEAKIALREVAQEQAQAIRTFVEEQRKSAVVQQDQLRRGIQPPGGTPPMPTPQPNYKLGSQELFKAAVADLEALSRGE